MSSLQLLIKSIVSCYILWYCSAVWHCINIAWHCIHVQAILLADVLPSLLVKLTAPFYIHLMSYRSHHLSFGFNNVVQVLLSCSSSSFAFVASFIAFIATSISPVSMLWLAECRRPSPASFFNGCGSSLWLMGLCKTIASAADDAVFDTADSPSTSSTRSQEAWLGLWHVTSIWKASVNRWHHYGFTASSNSSGSDEDVDAVPSLQCEALYTRIVCTFLFCFVLWSPLIHLYMFSLTGALLLITG